MSVTLPDRRMARRPGKVTLHEERSGDKGMPSRSKLRYVKQIGTSEMPKLKSKSSARKRFRLTGTGKVRMNYAKKRHMLRRKTQKMKRHARGTRIMSAADAKIVTRHFLPYA